MPPPQGWRLDTQSPGAPARRGRCLLRKIAVLDRSSQESYSDRVKRIHNMPARIAFAILYLLAVPILAFSQQTEIVPIAAGQYAERVDDLMGLLLGISAFFFVLILGLLFAFAIKFRARKQSGDGAPIRGNHALEVVWTAIPLVLMAVLAGLSAGLIFEQYNPPQDVLIVKVNALSFDWEFEYYEMVSEGSGSAEFINFICGNPGNFVHIRKLNVSSSSELILPVNRPVRFLITSEDVLHSFWVPEYRIKRDAVPDYVSDAWFEASKTGTFRIICAELCGVDHAVMIGALKVVPTEEFDSWMADRQAVASISSGN